MLKKYLLTPGPTPIPESVLAALAQPILHHRTRDFEAIFSDVRRDLKKVFQTSGDVLMLSASGTGSMEATITGLFSAGDRVLVIQGGKFGERWAKIAKQYGLSVDVFKIEPGQAMDLHQFEQVIAKTGPFVAVLFQASETSTGARFPVQEICQISKQHHALAVCDAITACGVFDLPMDRWGIDVLLSGSQKAFMLPPGLAMIALSDAAWKQVERSKLPKFYFDLKKERTMQAKNQTAWTPSISLIVGLKESLRIILDEGLEKVFERHEFLARATRAGVEALGLEILSKDCPSTAVTAVKVPKEIHNGKLIPTRMRDRFGVVITGGQDELEGKIFRLSHFGYCGPFDVLTGISALEMVLAELGYAFEMGIGTTAVQKLIMKEWNR